jgi:hypothetical protein
LWFVLQIPISQNLPELFAAVNVSATANLLARQASEMCVSQNFKKGREFVQNRCMAMLRAYRSSAVRSLSLSLFIHFRVYFYLVHLDCVVYYYFCDGFVVMLYFVLRKCLKHSVNICFYCLI